jgi:hypothetical protein
LASLALGTENDSNWISDLGVQQELLSPEQAVGLPSMSLKEIRLEVPGHCNSRQQIAASYVSEKLFVMEM